MIILVGNQKGGAGKSTLTLLIANYLSQIRQRNLTVVDMDYQQSIAQLAEKGKILSNSPLYDVVPADLKFFPSIQSVMKGKEEQIVLIDLPGKMDDDGLIPVFAAADLIVCPFSYDQLSVDSTLLFSLVVRKINDRCPIVFVPNRMKSMVKYDTKVEVDKVLQQFGLVTPGIADRIDFQRITTVSIPLTVIPVVIPVLDLIFDNYIGKEISS